ncbi:conjugal transfer protein MobB [Chishuiella sp.]|uniref:conjugal transfer protein MobB n=1 Tax=Chishuiella sp. TaxID=1969467 RepID=UPI0028A9443F|nr:conjugal transfer protein MobB [Chishuiella sp.]
MIAKIGRSSNLYGALAYNTLKVEKENGQILYMSKMIETSNGKYSIGQLIQSFSSYLIANRKTEKHTLHISLNPNPKNKVSDKQFQEIAKHYMEQMGYGEQPFIVFKHTDTTRTHIHIVSVCIDKQGKKISDKFEKKRSMKICREIEQKFGLIPATKKDFKINNNFFKPVNYSDGDLKSQIASVVRYLPSYYKYQTFGEYNALLSLFNITAEKVEGEINGKIQKGLLYFPINENKEKIGMPFKASLFGKNAGLIGLETLFKKNKNKLKNHPSKLTLKLAISSAFKSTNNEQNFKESLAEQNINVIVRKNSENRIYGVTFIDHNSRIVYNGSQLGKEFSANIFNNYWKKNTSEMNVSDKHQQSMNYNYDDANFLNEENHHLFDFLDNIQQQETSADIYIGLLPKAQNEDYEELDSVIKPNRKRKRKRNQ